MCTHRRAALGVGAASQIANVSHVFQPSDRFWLQTQNTTSRQGSLAFRSAEKCIPTGDRLRRLATRTNQVAGAAVSANLVIGVATRRQRTAWTGIASWPEVRERRALRSAPHNRRTRSTGYPAPSSRRTVLAAARISMTEQQIAAVDVATVFRFLGPTDGPAIAAEQRILPQCREIDMLRDFRER